MDKTAKVYLAGHAGFLGHALYRKLLDAGFCNMIIRSHQELDLTNQEETLGFFMRERPEYVFFLAARSGGVMAERLAPASFIYDNLMMQCNVLEASRAAGSVRKLLLVASASVYPSVTQQPISETAIMTGVLHPSHEYYALAKIAGIKMAEAFRKQYNLVSISVVPTNIFGPGDSFDPVKCNVVAALMRRMHEAVVAGAPHVVVGGTGNASRDFLYVEDAADACIYLMQNYSGDKMINLGSQQEVTIQQLAETIKSVCGYTGTLINDTSFPDGAPRRVLDSSQLQTLGWKCKCDLETGLHETYKWYRETLPQGE